MKIVIINLEKCKERYERISKSLSKLNLPFERFNAVNGYILSDEEIDNNVSFIGKNFLCNRGIIGCAMSHIKIWKEFQKSNEDLICVVEDDAQFNRPFKHLYDIVDKIYDKLQFDFLNLNCGGINHSFSDKIVVDNYTFNKPLFPTLFTCYILSKKGVNKLLNYINKINYHIDFDIACYNLTNDFEYYSLYEPNILENTCEDSTINGNMSGILAKILNLLGLQKINWVLNTPILTLFLDYKITTYRILLIFLIFYFFKNGFYIISLIFLLDLVLNMF
jgi:glycosyl transferase family 25